MGRNSHPYTGRTNQPNRGRAEWRAARERTHMGMVRNGNAETAAVQLNGICRQRVGHRGTAMHKKQYELPARHAFNKR